MPTTHPYKEDRDHGRQSTDGHQPAPAQCGNDQVRHPHLKTAANRPVDLNTFHTDTIIR